MQVSATWVGIKIWGITVFFNAVLLGCWIGVQEGAMGILSAVVVLFLGCLVSAPLLLLVVPLVKLSQQVPYANVARINWLMFWLAVLIIAFYGFGSWLFDGHFFRYQMDMIRLNAGTLLALLLSGLVNRAALKKLYSAGSTPEPAINTDHSV